MSFPTYDEDKSENSGKPISRSLFLNKTKEVRKKGRKEIRIEMRDKREKVRGDKVDSRVGGWVNYDEPHPFRKE